MLGVWESRATRARSARKHRNVSAISISLPELLVLLHMSHAHSPHPNAYLAVLLQERDDLMLLVPPLRNHAEAGRAMLASALA